MFGAGAAAYDAAGDDAAGVGGWTCVLLRVRHTFTNLEMRGCSPSFESSMSGKRARAKRRDDKIKGNLVEQIITQMHRVRGVTVEPNARLKSKRNPKRRREIDVLLTARVAGYEVRIAFECKNYKKVPDVVKIGEFADNLTTLVSRQRTASLYRRRVLLLEHSTERSNSG